MLLPSSGFVQAAGTSEILVPL